MRMFLGMICAVIALSGVEVWAEESVIRLSEPVHATETYEDFGAALPPSPEALALGEALSKLDELQGESVVIETEVQQVCRKKGCFFIARDGDAVARVRFKDYAFFIPTDSAGKTVTLAGTVGRERLTPDQAAHYAEDLGEEPGDDAMPGFEYRIMATAVRVPKT